MVYFIVSPEHTVPKKLCAGGTCISSAPFSGVLHWVVGDWGMQEVLEWMVLRTILYKWLPVIAMISEVWSSPATVNE